MSSLQHIGHRLRLKERFLKAGITSLADYEILEMLLFSSHPRGDLKPLAKTLLEKFETISGVLNADIHKLRRINEIRGSAGACLNFLKRWNNIYSEKMQNKCPSFIHGSMY